MKNSEIWYCFPNYPQRDPYVLWKLIHEYSKGDRAGKLDVGLVVESQSGKNDALVVILNCGFHCLHIPIDDILMTLKETGVDLDRVKIGDVRINGK